MIGRAEVPALPKQAGVEFRHVEGFPGYCVGDDGSVWGWRWGSVTKKCRPPRWRQLNPSRDSNGYPRVSLVKDGKKHERRVHALVLELFVGQRQPGMQCCHGDGNPANNAVSNLRWDTPEGNMADKEKHGTLPHGSEVVTAKLNDEQVKLIVRLLEIGVAAFRIAYAFDVSETTIGAIAKGQTWQRLTNISYKEFRHWRSKKSSLGDKAELT